MNLINDLVASQGGFSPSFFRTAGGRVFFLNPVLSTLPPFGVAPRARLIRR